MMKGPIFLKHNSFTEGVPIAVALKALGVQSDKEILLLCARNTEPHQAAFSPNLEEAAKLGIFTTQQARESDACYSEGCWSAQTSLGGGHGVISRDCLDACTGCQSRFDFQGTML